MEYVEGASLKDLIKRGLSIGEAVELIRQILNGAKFAHEHGIIHRDLKPQNVLVDREGRARVADFGIARAGRLGDHPDGLGARHRAVPLARAGPGPRDHDRVGRLLGRGDALRGAHRAGAVPGRDPGGRGAQADLRAAPPALGAQPAGPAGARRGRAARPRQGPDGTLRDGGRVPARPRRGRGRSRGRGSGRGGRAAGGGRARLGGAGPG